MMGFKLSDVESSASHQKGVVSFCLTAGDFDSDFWVKVASASAKFLTVKVYFPL